MSNLISKNIEKCEILRSRTKAYKAIGFALCVWSLFLFALGSVQSGVFLFFAGLSFFVDFLTFFVLFASTVLICTSLAILNGDSNRNTVKILNNKTPTRNSVSNVNCLNKKENSELSLVDIRNAIKCSK